MVKAVIDIKEDTNRSRLFFFKENPTRQKKRILAHYSSPKSTKEKIIKDVGNIQEERRVLFSFSQKQSFWEFKKLRFCDFGIPKTFLSSTRKLRFLGVPGNFVSRDGKERKKERA